MQMKKTRKATTARNGAEIIRDAIDRTQGANVLWRGQAKDGSEMLIHPVTGKRAVEQIDVGAKESGIINWIISTDEVDRANERLDPKGVQIKRYAENPVILWSHNSFDTPIGKAAAMPRVKQLSGTKNALYMPLIFHKQTPLSAEVAALVESEYLQAGSVGFIPLSYYEESRDKYPESYDLYWSNTVRTYDQWELLEFSICSIPMNPGALVQRSAESFVRGAIERNIIPNDGALVTWANSISPDRIIIRADDPAALPPPPPASPQPAPPAQAEPEPVADDSENDSDAMTDEEFLLSLVEAFQAIVAAAQLLPATVDREDVNAFAAEIVPILNEKIVAAVALLNADAANEDESDAGENSTPPANADNATGNEDSSGPLPGAVGAAIREVYLRATNFRELVFGALQGAHVAPEQKVGRKISKKNRELINTAHDAIVLLKAAADDGFIDDEEAEEIADAAAQSNAILGGEVNLSAIITNYKTQNPMTISELVADVAKAVGENKTEAEIRDMLIAKINIANVETAGAASAPAAEPNPASDNLNLTEIVDKAVERVLAELTARDSSPNEPANIDPEPNANPAQAKSLEELRREFAHIL